ncbi:MOSC domain-containing protein [Sphingobacteriales bacterium UPWRP_1]|nr:hypothetical protein BVG80_02830 [Sphingobacteriales bacterium TSM_CSM]PSJ75421.1 MOSC domain-containing protein [Sphingobacteriales bacterium UPWRP_1]
MQVVWVNTGKTRQVVWEGKTVNTGIFKEPAAGVQKITFSGFAGDEQADLHNHGGADKAVYAYELAYYEHWKLLLQRSDWPGGLFGENLTTTGLPDHEVMLGDVYRTGSAILQAVQPRIPCFKLNLRFNLPNMADLFYQQQRHGTYFRVLQEGFVEAGAAITLLERPQNSVSISRVAQCFVTKGQDKALLHHILQIPVLPQRLRQVFTRFAQEL